VAVVNSGINLHFIFFGCHSDMAVTCCAGVVGCDMAVGNGDGRGMGTVQQGVNWDRLGDSVAIPVRATLRSGPEGLILARENQSY
jgi:hypothetical protein